MCNKLLASGLVILSWIFASSVIAATINFSDFSDVSSLTLNGSAAGLNPNSANVLLLTNALSQSGSSFSTDTVTLTDASFSTAFTFSITNPIGVGDTDGQGADGIAFVIQTIANNVGGSGGGIGYQGISNSVAIEFDTYNNGGWDDNNGNHVGINLSGNIDSEIQTSPATRMNNGATWYCWIDYNGETDLLEAYLSETNIRSDSSMLSYTVDLAAILGSPSAYVGFTSGTGSGGGSHQILSWEFRESYDPIDPAVVPEPSTYLLLGMGLSGLAFYRKIKKNSP